MSRLQPLEIEALSQEQKRIHNEIASGPRGTVPAPQQVWLHNPGLCDPAQKLGAYCRYGTALPTTLSELAILVVGRNWKADYEWWAHARIARDAGVSNTIIEAIRVGNTPDFSSAAEHSDIVYRAAKEMLETGRLSDATYSETEAKLGRAGLIDLVGIVGYYCLISLTLNVFEVPTPDGTEPFADVS